MSFMLPGKVNRLLVFLKAGNKIIGKFADHRLRMRFPVAGVIRFVKPQQIFGVTGKQ